MIIWKLETLARARGIQTTTSISPFFSVESRTIPLRVVLRFGEKCVLQPPRGLILTGDRDSPTLKTREKDRIFGPVSISKYKMSGMSGGESGIRTHGTVSRTHAFQACALSHSAISPKRPLMKARADFCK
jgi:hypothetical protein